MRSVAARAYSRRQDGASRVDSAICGNIVDLTTRDADVHQLAVRQPAQLVSQPLAFAPLTKRIPICFEGTVVLPPCDCRSELSDPVDRAHCGVSKLGYFTKRKLPAHPLARLTAGLHFPYRQLILCAPGASEVTSEKEWQIALSFRGIHI